ncbi:MAG: deoxyribose-phosphate aldolase [bacterium]
MTLQNPWWPDKPVDLAAMIDHTLLRPSATRKEIIQVASEGLASSVASVCVHPIWVSNVAEVLRGSKVKVCTVVGFPSGAHRPQSIAFEADRAVREGAEEVDMVIPLGRAKMGNWEIVGGSISTVKAAIGSALLKVILETSELTDEEIIHASETAFDAGAEFVKSSTGFSTGGATVHAIQLMAKVATSKGGAVKASGGIRTLKTLQAMVEAGARRIGTSSTLKILKELQMSLEET